MKRACSIGLSLALALAFALIFYTFNTPLGPTIGSDNAMYLTLGTALARGYRPYLDIFDHKGPLLYLLQLLPQALSGGNSTLAVFLMELAFLFASLRVLAAIARTLSVPEALCQLCYLALGCTLVGGGNLTEEYSALPTLLGLLLALRCFGGAAADRLPSRAILLGICAGCCALLRVNNALPLTCFALTLAAALWVRGRMIEVALAALGTALGILLAFLPIVLWLLHQGALSAAFDGTVLHNLRYSAAGDGSRRAMLLSPYGGKAFLLLALGAAGAFSLREKRNGLGIALFSASLAGFVAAFISRKFYQHYLSIALPTASVGFALAFARLPRRSVRLMGAGIAAICLLWLSWQGIGVDRERRARLLEMPQFVADARALYDRVPEAERDRFMAYRVEPKWYPSAGALPCMRHYFLQEILAQADPAIMDEIVAHFESDPPLWLVIYYNRPFSPPYDPRVQAIFETRYAFVDSAGTYQLLRLIPEAGR